MKRKIIVPLFVFLLGMNLPILYELISSQKGVFEKSVFTVVFLYVYWIFSVLVVKLLLFLNVSKEGRVYKKRKKVVWMTSYLSILVSLYVAYIYSGELIFLTTVILAGTMAFSDISSTIVDIDGICFYYSDSSFAKIEVEGKEEKNKVMVVKLVNGENKRIY